MAHKDWLLFTHDCDGEYYEGAFDTLVLAKEKAVELWTHTTSDFTVRRTSDDEFSAYGELAWKRDRRYLKWSDESPTDTSGQKNKTAQFARDDKEAAEKRDILFAKRDSGAKLTLAEKMACSMYDTQAAMLATLLSQPPPFPWPDGQPLFASGHPQERTK